MRTTLLLLVGILTVTTTTYAQDEQAIPTESSDATPTHEVPPITRSTSCCYQPLSTTSTQCAKTGLAIGSNTICCPSGGQISYSLTDDASVACDCGTELQTCDGEDEGHVADVQFKCDDGIVFPMSAVDDDFCDCEDGSDEPHTSACSPVGKFVCGNDGFMSKLIVTSRVNDGVCDCCDGSDENTGGLECANTCGIKAAKLKILFRERNERLAAGFAVRDNRMAAKAKDLEKFRSKNFNAEAELRNVRGKVKALKQEVDVAKEEAQVLNDARVAKFKSGAIEKAMLLDVASVDDVASVLCLLILEAGVEGVNTFYQLTKEHLVNGNSHLERVDVADEEVVLQMIKEREERAQGESVVTTNADIDALKLKLLVKEIQFDNSKESLPLFTRAIAMAVKQVNVMREAAKALAESNPSGPSWSDDAVDAAIALMDTIETDKLIELERKLETLELTEKAKEQTAKKAKDVEGLDFGPQDTLFLLFDECVSKAFGEYNYEVCGYKTAKQANTKLGKFDRIEFFGGEVEGGANLDPTVPHISAIMYFIDGQNCHGVGKRSATVKLTCGEQDELLEVEEPNKCEYELTLRSPGACMGAITVEEEVMRQAVLNARSTIVGNIKVVFSAAFTWVKSCFV